MEGAREVYLTHLIEHPPPPFPISIHRWSPPPSNHLLLRLRCSLFISADRDGLVLIDPLIGCSHRCCELDPIPSVLCEPPFVGLQFNKKKKRKPQPEMWRLESHVQASAKSATIFPILTEGVQSRTLQWIRLLEWAFSCNLTWQHSSMRDSC